MHKKALVMFDWDGCIADTLNAFITHFLAACHEHGFVEVRSAKDILDLFEENVYKSMEKFGLSGATINLILKSYEDKTRDVLEGIELFDGMVEVLTKIAEKNKVFIITSNLSSIPEKVLGRYGITCVEDVIGAEKEKSKVRKIEKLIKDYPDLCPWYVGDTKGDMLEGKQSGARTIGVAWGWHGPEKLLECSPDFIAYTPSDLLDLLLR